MGDIRRKHNLYSRPKKLFESARIEEENKIKRNYGLKNKTEIWKAAAKVSLLRKRAKKLISQSDSKDSNDFFKKLQAMGIDANTTSDVLALNTENILNRRLQTLVFKKGFAKTPLGARQLIVHKNILVNGRAVNIPSFLVSKESESKIELRIRNKQEKDSNE